MFSDCVLHGVSIATGPSIDHMFVRFFRMELCKSLSISRVNRPLLTSSTRDVNARVMRVIADNQYRYLSAGPVRKGKSRYAGLPV
jgi:hypothetical protein